MQEAVPKFMQIGLGFAGRPSDDSEHFARYFELGLKVKTAQQIQDEYMEIVEKRLKEIGLDMPAGVQPNYDMRVGYASATPEPAISGAK